MPGVTPLLLICGYYILFETLPCILILYYFRRLPPPPPAQEQLIDSGGPHHDYHSIVSNNSNNMDNGSDLNGPTSSGSNGTKFGFDKEFPGQSQYGYQINNGR